MPENDTAPSEVPVIPASSLELPPAKVQKDRASTKESEGLFGDPKRQEETKQAIHSAFIWFLRIAAGAFMLVFMVRIIHFILPSGYCWLTDIQQQSIDKFFFSGAMGALVMRYLRQVVPEDKKFGH